MRRRCVCRQTRHSQPGSFGENDWMQSSKNGSANVPLGTAPEVVADYAHYCRPELAQMLQSLSLDAVYERAEGNYLWQRRGEHLVKVLDLVGGFGRSEERRVGKECRSLWSP